MVGKNASALTPLLGIAQQFVEIVAIKNVVTQHQRARRPIQKGLAD